MGFEGGVGLHSIMKVCYNVSYKHIASNFRATIIIWTAMKTLKVAQMIGQLISIDVQLMWEDVGQV
jgi:hypothetical protein